MQRDRLGPSLIAVGSLGAALAALSATQALSSIDVSDRGLVAALSVFMIATTVGVGIYAWRREPRNRFGPLLVTAGLLWGMTTLTVSSDETLHSVGRVSHWAAELALLYLILSYPTGTLRTRAERTVFYAGVALVVLLYLPTTFFVAQFDHPFPLESCSAGCPPNAFMLASSEPGFIGDVISPVRDTLALGVYAAAIAVYAARLRAGAPALRPILAPVLGAEILRLAAAGVFALGRHWTSAGAFEVFGWIAVYSISLISLGFLIGLLNWRVLEAKALERLTGRLSEEMRPEQLQPAVSEALEDPTVELLFADPAKPGAWLGGDGLPAAAPRASPDREVLAVPDEAPTVAIIHDAALHEPRAFVESVGACVFAAVEQRRLTTALQHSVQEVSESRSRIATAATEERRRLERDLHDSVQQQLVMLRVQLQLATDAVEKDPAGGIDRLRGLGSSVNDVLEEIRSVARGIYPPLLADGGLVDALEMVAIRASVPTTVTGVGVGRYPPASESAVYFCCLEAIQNAAKHASGATLVSILLVDDGALRFEVRDDGPGFRLSDNGNGIGLTNMRDRLAAVGGELEIVTAPGSGTMIRGTMQAL